jgi:NAD(P)-dependent dehydrogenase (short-subunit alcohol dehydrogenase family)
MTTQRTWLITGASRGFGFEITKAVLATGDNVVATVRSRPEETTGKFDNHQNLLVLTVDVTVEEQVKQAALMAIARFERIDVLVNNAGYGLLAGVEEATDAEVRKNYDTNVFGTLNMIRAVLPYMRETRSGHIINISSIGGLSGFGGWGIYGSTKFAIEGLTEALAQEVAPLGIHATVVAPGFFHTNFLDHSSLTRTSNEIEDYADTVGSMRQFASQASYRQPGDPEKLAQAIVKIAASIDPPVHLPLGSDTLTRFRDKVAAFEKDIERWHDIITGTDHEDVKVLVA